MKHVPVMVEEVLRFLLHPESKLVLDGTVGCGGHASALLSTNESLRLIGVDRDADALHEASLVLRSFGNRVQLMNHNYADIDDILRDERTVDGILLDLGISSLQIDRAARGFSHSQNGPLDMRMTREGNTAGAVLAGASVEDLTRMLRNYGEIERPRRIARAIRAAADVGDMETTGELRAAVVAAVGERRATPSLLSQVFQAVRIVVNDEIDNLRRFLSALQPHLAPAARIVVLSYHSLEDREIKTFFARESRDCICPPRTPVCVCGHKAWLKVLTHRVAKPSSAEVARNPRSRSAKLRAAAALN